MRMIITGPYAGKIGRVLSYDGPMVAIEVPIDGIASLVIWVPTVSTTLTGASK